jgi:hypothetical protein
MEKVHVMMGVIVEGAGPEMEEKDPDLEYNGKSVKARRISPPPSPLDCNAYQNKDSPPNLVLDAFGESEILGQAVSHIHERSVGLL